MTYNPSSGGSAVSSVFGRTGTVISAANDYAFSQLSGAASVGQLPAHTHAAADVTSGVLATSLLPDRAIRATANTALSASTTINVAALDLAVASGDVWVLDYILPFTVSGGTAGLKPIFSLPASSTGSFDATGATSGVTAYSFTHSTTPTSASAVAFGTALFTGYLYVRAVLTMGAAGTCRIGVTTGTSAAGNILAGASVIAMKL